MTLVSGSLFMDKLRIEKTQPNSFTIITIQYNMYKLRTKVTIYLSAYTYMYDYVLG